MATTCDPQTLYKESINEARVKSLFISQVSRRILRTADGFIIHAKRTLFALGTGAELYVETRVAT